MQTIVAQGESISSEYLGPLRDSADVANDPDELTRRMQSDGYVYLRAFFDRDDDIRSAASLELVKLLKAKGCTVRAHDPAAMENFKTVHPDLVYCQSPYEACEGADLAILVTEWNQYRQLDFNWLREAMTGKAFLDCRNVYDRPHLEKFDFTYDCFGRADHSSPTG